MFTIFFRAFLMIAPAILLSIFLLTDNLESAEQVALATSKPFMCVVFGIYEAILFKIWVMPYLADRIVKFLYGDQGSLDESMERILQDIREGRKDEALKALEAYTADYPLHLTGWTERANLLRDGFKRPQDAVKVLEEAVAHISGKEDKALLLYRMARIYELSLDNTADAQKTYRLIAEQYPRTAYGREALAHISE